MVLGPKPGYGWEDQNQNEVLFLDFISRADPVSELWVASPFHNP